MNPIRIGLPPVAAPDEAASPALQPISGAAQAPTPIAAIPRIISRRVSDLIDISV
jgi:hypothetical protein